MMSKLLRGIGLHSAQRNRLTCPIVEHSIENLNEIRCIKHITYNYVTYLHILRGHMPTALPEERVLAAWLPFSFIRPCEKRITPEMAYRYGN